jgi:hypothetical protein
LIALTLRAFGALAQIVDPVVGLAITTGRASGFGTSTLCQKPQKSTSTKFWIVVSENYTGSGPAKQIARKRVFDRLTRIP